MTTDEFDRILTALKYTSNLNIIPIGIMIPYRAVVEILHSNLHPEDKTRYAFDWTTNQIHKKED